MVLFSLTLYVCIIKDLASLLSSIEYLALSECIIDLVRAICHTKKQLPMRYALTTLYRDTIPLRRKAVPLSKRTFKSVPA